MKKGVMLSMCLALCITAAVVAQPPEIELMRAIEAGDRGKVEELIDAGVDVQLSPYLDDSPLYKAVMHDRLRIAELLLEEGADPNVGSNFGPAPSGNTYSHPLWAALRNGNEKMADLLISYGADENLVDLYYETTLYTFLRQGHVEKARSILDRGKVDLDADMTTLLLVYNSGTKEVRTFIEERGPDGLAQGEPNLLEMLVGRTLGIKDSQPTPEYPMATSFLPDTKQYFRYAPDKAFDGEKGTSWVENHPEAGIGEKIAFVIPGDTSEIAILPGYGDARYFELNNRVKRAELTIYILGRYAAQTTIRHEIRPTGVSFELTLDDEMELQRFQIGLERAAEQFNQYAPEEFLGVLEIKDVYEGTKWDDTCIAEIQFFH